MAGNLFIVATPIGNLGDITSRATKTLAEVDKIYAEDTRVTLKLLAHLGITKPLTSLHDHNESERVAGIITELMSGMHLALVSDAGTPLISDPGYRLVRAIREAGLSVIPIPGVSAIISALSAAGLPTDRFSFEGFLPAKSTARRATLEQLRQEVRTTVFYESSHRIEDLLDDMAAVFAEREVVIARELTKLYEQFYRGTAQQLAAQIKTDADMRRGEFVVMLAGLPDSEQKQAGNSLDTVQLIQVLLAEGLPVKQVAKIAAQLTGQPKNQLYRQVLDLSDSASET